MTQRLRPLTRPKGSSTKSPAVIETKANAPQGRTRWLVRVKKKREGWDNGDPPSNKVKLQTQRYLPQNLRPQVGRGGGKAGSGCVCCGLVAIYDSSIVSFRPSSGIGIKL